MCSRLLPAGNRQATLLWAMLSMVVSLLKASVVVFCLWMTCVVVLSIRRWVPGAWVTLKSHRMPRIRTVKPEFWCTRWKVLLGLGSLRFWEACLVGYVLRDCCMWPTSPFTGCRIGSLTCPLTVLWTLIGLLVVRIVNLAVRSVPPWRR